SSPASSQHHDAFKRFPWDEQRIALATMLEALIPSLFVKGVGVEVTGDLMSRRTELQGQCYFAALTSHRSNLRRQHCLRSLWWSRPEGNLRVSGICQDARSPPQERSAVFEAVAGV
ncbi:MAG: hypothetical protein WCJ64_23745, partial [Rhodospirillaceae bacterium]